MAEEPVGKALFRAVAARRPLPGPIHHPGRGGQSCGHGYQRWVGQPGMKTPVSRRGNRCDNAPMESFWGTLKNELVHRRRHETRAEAIQEMAGLIEIFYGRYRRRPRSGHLSPAAFTRQFYGKQLAA
ncbi:MAG: IS3 family transposase [Betaproteobacteria bacterium]|nr:IS3 family transposase [Betaproteobacteria bacterium]